MVYTMATRWIDQANVWVKAILRENECAKLMNDVLMKYQCKSACNTRFCHLPSSRVNKNFPKDVNPRTSGNT